MSDKPLSKCPTCRSKVEKLVSAAAFHLKGGGWYVDGYQKKAAAAGTNSTGETSGASTDSPSKDGGSSSKPEAKSAVKAAAKTSAKAGPGSKATGISNS